MLEAIKMYFLPCLINIITAIYISSRILKHEIDYLSPKLYFVIFILIIMAIFNFIFIGDFFRLIFITFVIFCGNYVLFKDNIKTTIIISLLEQLIAIVSEILFAVFIMQFLNANNENIITNYYGNTYANIAIAVIMIAISKLKIIEKIYIKLLKITTKIDYDTLVISSLVLFVTINAVVFVTYSSSNITKIFVINIFFLTIYCIIFFISMNEKSINMKFQKENEILLSNLNEYEKMLDYQRVNNHENKNQLLVIKSMIEKNSSNVTEYIEEIIKEKREDNEIVYNKAKRIPSGGLQGLIYQKMLIMQEKNIDIDLDIHKEVRKIDFGNLSPKMNYDICRIAGILIDNAIEETIKFNNKDREIIISMYVDEWFIIEISNRIMNDIDLSKIYDVGYTSKDRGHGYGLSLLKKIVTENENIINEVKIINNIFTQIIKIKM